MNHNRKKIIVIGIDEAGRGPLAGPVVVGGVCYVHPICNYGSYSIPLLRGIKDSKQLTAGKREQWFNSIRASRDFLYAVSVVSPAVIDRINIARATEKGVARVYKKIYKKLVLAAGIKPHMVILDGGLKLPADIHHKVFIKGDERFPLIAAGSIIAKVTRDRIMRKLHKKFPQYRFDLHKGYGTALHYLMLEQHGISHAHRRSFIKI